MVAKSSERKEAFFRIIVAIVSGVILYVWSFLIRVLAVIGWLYAIFANKRHKGMAELSEWWNTEAYKFSRYLTFVSNERPFPFSEAQSMSKFK